MTTNETNKTPTLIKSEIDSNVTLLTYRTNGVQHIFIDDKPILVGDKNSEGFKLKEKFFGKPKFKQGDIVKMKPEWQDEGDDDITFTCLEDEDGGRVRIVYDIDLHCNPQSIVTTDMIQKGSE